jgi:hypothetical protein
MRREKRYLVFRLLTLHLLLDPSGIMNPGVMFPGERLEG